MELSYNENSDLLEVSKPINQSLFNDIFNRKLWEWYREFGICDKAPGRYLYFRDGRMLFDKDVEKQALKSGIFKQIALSFTLAGKIMREADRYDPAGIMKLYESESSVDYSRQGRREILDWMNKAWEMLLDNFKYSIIAGFIIQYKIHVFLRDGYKTDINARRYNAIIDVHEGRMPRSEFDEKFGFLAERDYDLSCPRYIEQKWITPPRERLSETYGDHNFREHVKYYNMMLLAIIRRQLLALGKNSFNKTREELNAQAVSQDEAGAELGEPIPAYFEDEFKPRPDEDEQASLHGKRLSGKGIVSGRVAIVRTKKDYVNVTKGSIVVSDRLDPGLVVLFPLIKGIVSEKGGQLSHVAIVAREKGLPVLGQANGAIKAFKDKKRATIDLDSQQVY